MVDPVPALPDSERRTAYTITAATGPYNVGFAIYGDNTDYANWVQVTLDGVELSPATDWTLDSPSGSLSTLPRPITDARVTLTTARTGTLAIIGRRRPRRLTQFTEGAAIPARTHNVTYTDVVAVQREMWDRVSSLESEIDAAFDLLGDQPQPNVLIFESRAAAIAAAPNIASNVSIIEVHGWDLPGDMPPFSYEKTGAGTFPTGWSLAPRIWFFPEQFGAVGDNIADDTSAMNTVAGLGVSIWLREGKVYRVTGRVTLASGTTIAGPGKIQYAGPIDGTVRDTLNISGKTNITLRDFQLDGGHPPGTAVSGHWGIFGQDLTTGLQTLTINYTENVIIDNVKITNYAECSILGGWWRHVAIVRNKLGQVGAFHVQLNSPTEFTINDNKCQDLSPGFGTLAAGQGASIILGRSATAPMLLQADAPVPNHGVVDGNTFADIAGRACIDFHSGEDVTVSDNVTNNCAKGINLEHAVTRGTSADNAPDNFATAFNTTTTIYLGTGALQKDDYYNGAAIIPTSGALLGVERTISDYDGATRVATVSVAWASIPAPGTTFSIYTAATDSSKGRGAVDHSIIIDGNSLGGRASSVECDYGIAVDAWSSQSVGTFDELSSGIKISNNVIRHHGMPTPNPPNAGTFGTAGAAIVVRNAWLVDIVGNTFPLTYGRCINIAEKVRNATVRGNNASNITLAQGIQTMIDLTDGTSTAFASDNVMDSANTQLFRATVGSSDTTGLHIGPGNIVRGTGATFLGGIQSVARPAFTPVVRTWRKGPPAALYYAGEYVDLSSTATLAVTAGLMYACLFVINHFKPWNRIGIECTAGAAGNVRLGLYEMDTSGQPGTLLFDAGTVAVGGATPIEATIAVPIAPEPGVYWGVCLFDNTPTIRVHTPGPGYQVFLAQGTPGAGHNCQLTRAQAFGALPASFGAPTRANANVPTMWLRHGV